MPTAEPIGEVALVLGRATMINSEGEMADLREVRLF